MSSNLTPSANLDIFQRGSQGPERPSLGEEYLPVLVLTHDGTARIFDAMGNMDCLKHPFELPVLCYGQDYILVPNHAGPCDLVADVSGAPDGYLIQSTSDLFLRGDFAERESKAYHDMMSRRIRGAPGGPLAVFAEWRLWLANADKPSVLILYRHANPTAKIVAT